MAEASTLIENLFESVKKFPNKLAIADYKDELSYLELWHSIEATSQKLTVIGIKPKERIVFSIDNRVEFIILHFSIIKIGAVSIPLDIQTPKKSIQQIIDISNPRSVFSDHKFKSYLEDNDKIDFFDTSETIEVVKEIQDKQEIKNDSSYNSKNISSILYTSGSTGIPKGVILTHGNTTTTIQNIVNFCSYTDEDFELVTLPLTHSFGLGQVYSMLFVGGSCYVENGLIRMKRVLNALNKYNITGFPTTPKGVDLILENYSELFKNFRDDLKTIIVNSAPLMPEQTRKLQNLLPTTKIYVYYGLTEASRSSFGCLTEMGEKLYRSVGKPMNSVKIFLSDDNEILISGPTVSKGYWPNNFFEISSEGFPIIQTGDIGKFDDEGNLFITGRIKDQINIGGFKVDPFEIEKVLKDHPVINNIVVSSRTVGNEEEIVYCLTESNKNIADDEIIDFLRGKIEHYKFPKDIIFLKEFPEGVNGKIDRKKIKEIISKLN